MRGLAKRFFRKNLTDQRELLTTIISNVDQYLQCRACSLIHTSFHATHTNPCTNYSSCSSARSNGSLGMIYHKRSFVRKGKRKREGERALSLNPAAWVIVIVQRMHTTRMIRTFHPARCIRRTCQITYLNEEQLRFPS